MQKQYLAKTKNDVEVFLYEDSHAITHFKHQPKLLDFVKKIIPTIEAEGEIFRIEKNIVSEVLFSNLIETNDQDEIVYAKRPLREGYARFVKNRKSTSISWLTLDLRRVKENEYGIYTAFAGRLTPSFPGGAYLSEQSREFWSKHALVYDVRDITDGTETNKCPW